VTMNNSTDAVKPGHIVTTTGEGDRAVAWPDAANDVCLGVVGCAPGHDVDTAYSTGVMMPVYVKGSGAEVWVRVKTSAGAITKGAELMHDGGTAVNGLAILGTELVFEHLGYSTMHSSDVAAERWCKVVLN
jgi:hypothetical protein